MEEMIQIFVVESSYSENLKNLVFDIACGSIKMITKYHDIKYSLGIPLHLYKKGLCDNTEQWQKDGNKVKILKADTETILEISKNIDHIRVNESVLVIWPMLDSKIPRILKGLAEL